jgi:hypothetical protein
MNFRSFLDSEIGGAQQGLDKIKKYQAQANRDAGVKGAPKPPPSPLSPRGLGVPLEQPKPGFSGGGKWKLPSFSSMSPGTKYKHPDFSPFSPNNKWTLRTPGIMGK